MKPSEYLSEKKNLNAIKAILDKYSVTNPKVFGSAATGNDSGSSDIDILIDEGGELSLMDIASLAVELEELCGFKVDITTTYGIPKLILEKINREAIKL